LSRNGERRAPESAMTNRNDPHFARRDVLRALAAGGVAAAASAAPLAPAAAAGVTNAEKRKAQYQPNSAEVQTFYRVNRYPKKK
jgi:sugar (pentulose or hexulose) kinase